MPDSIVAPEKVNTIEDEVPCPNELGADCELKDGECSLCGFKVEPKGFDKPDVEIAKEFDMKQQQQQENRSRDRDRERIFAGYRTAAYHPSFGLVVSESNQSTWKEMFSNLMPRTAKAGSENYLVASAYRAIYNPDDKSLIHVASPKSFEEATGIEPNDGWKYFWASIATKYGLPFEKIGFINSEKEIEFLEPGNDPDLLKSVKRATAKYNHLAANNFDKIVKGENMDKKESVQLVMTARAELPSDEKLEEMGWSLNKAATPDPRDKENTLLEDGQAAKNEPEAKVIADQEEPVLSSTKEADDDSSSDESSDSSESEVSAESEAPAEEEVIEEEDQVNVLEVPVEVEMPRLKASSENILTAMKLAKLEDELGLTKDWTGDEFARAASLETEELSELRARISTLENVKEAGLSKSASKPKSALPRLKDFTAKKVAAVEDSTQDESIFLA